MSIFSKIRTKIHTTPGLRQVSQTWANTFGLGKAYAEYDKKIGITDSGEPAPAAATQFDPRFDRQDLAAYVTDQYPNTAMLVGHYRQFQAATPRRSPMPAPIGPDELADSADYYVDEEEDFGGDYYDQEPE